MANEVITKEVLDVVLSRWNLAQWDMNTEEFAELLEIETKTKEGVGHAEELHTIFMAVAQGLSQIYRGHLVTLANYKRKGG